MASNSKKKEVRRKMKKAKMGKSNKKKRSRGMPPFPIHPE